MLIDYTSFSCILYCDLRCLPVKVSSAFLTLRSILKRKRIHSLVLLLFFLCGLGACTSETPVLSEAVSPFHIYSRGMNAEEVLPENTEALFNAVGGLNIDCKVFTYSNGVWKSDKYKPEWTDTETPTTLTALSPVYADRTYSQKNLYDAETGALTDILIAQSTFDTQSNINLKFTHLFSKLTVRVHFTLNDTLKQLSLTVPEVVGINPVNGAITLSESDTHTTSLSCDESGDYTFIIPPRSSKFTLNLITKNSVISRSLSHDFNGGYQYECNVVDRKAPGIWNADDLIEFAKLINTPNTYTGKRKLDEFKTQDGVFRLMADITLTEAQNNELKPIGYNNKHYFTDTFDGGNHTISNLIISPYNGTAGLFGVIEEGGIVKNLHLVDCSSIEITQSASLGVGFIAGRNKGEVINCSVNKGVLNNLDASRTGGIVGYNAGGRVVNCLVRNTNITATASPVGSIIGEMDSHGCILNCSAMNNTIQNKSNCKNSRGGICGRVASTGTISNCFLYNLSFDNRKTNRGLIVGDNSIELSITHCLYGKNNNLNLYNTSCHAADNESYDSDLITTNTKIPVIQKLNNWIDTTGKKSYSEITFKRWSISKDGTVVFK